MTRKSLLERARGIRGQRGRRTSEDAELAVAWAQGTIGVVQICEVLGVKVSSRGSVYNFLAIALKQAVANGLLVAPNGKRAK